MSKVIKPNRTQKHSMKQIPVSRWYTFYMSDVLKDKILSISHIVAGKIFNI